MAEKPRSRTLRDALSAAVDARAAAVDARAAAVAAAVAAVTLDCASSKEWDCRWKSRNVELVDCHGCCYCFG